MLTVAYASQVTKDTFDRRKKVGAGRASDIWSLGCLFFELLTNDFLFYDADWVRFFIRVTSDNELVTPEKEVLPFLRLFPPSCFDLPSLGLPILSRLLPWLLSFFKVMLDNNKDLIGYLKYVLQRKEAYRPTLYDMIQRFKVFLFSFSFYPPLPPFLLVTLSLSFPFFFSPSLSPFPSSHSL